MSQDRIYLDSVRWDGYQKTTTLDLYTKKRSDFQAANRSSQTEYYRTLLLLLLCKNVIHDPCLQVSCRFEFLNQISTSLTTKIKHKVVHSSLSNWRFGQVTICGRLLVWNRGMQVARTCESFYLGRRRRGNDSGTSTCTKKGLKAIHALQTFIS